MKKLEGDFNPNYTWEYNLLASVRWDTDDVKDDVVFYVKIWLQKIAEEEGYKIKTDGQIDWEIIKEITSPGFCNIRITPEGYELTGVNRWVYKAPTIEELISLALQGYNEQQAK